MELQAIIKTTLATDIESEVNMLLERSKELVNSRQVASAIFAEWIDELESVWTATYTVAIKDDFGGWTVREQAWNDALWLVSLSLLAEFKAINSNTIAGALESWSSDAENCTTKLTSEQAQMMGDHFIMALQRQKWLSLQPTNFVEEIGGRPVSVSKFMQTELFQQVYKVQEDSLKERCHMVCQPLRFKPKDWTTNFDGIGENAKMRLIKGYKQSVVPEHVLKAANMAQSVAFEIHPDMLGLAQMVVDNEVEFRNALGYNNPDKRLKWEGVLQQWQELAKLELNQPYYFPVTYDFRGRMYYRGGVITPQGSDCCKAALVFHKGYPLGKHGFDALCVALATALGAKESVETRIKMVAKHVDEIIAYSKDFRQFCARFKEADFCQAWLLTREVERALLHKKEHGTFETFISNVPCHQDGTCSGLQHISVITKDYATASSVNMTPSGYGDKPADVYGLVGAVAGVGRDIAKNPVMLGGYGASEDTIKQRVIEKMQKDFNEETFNAILLGMEEKCPALHKYTNAVKSRAQSRIEKGDVEFIWNAFDGFPVVQQYIDNSANNFHGKHYSAHMKRHQPVLDGRKMVTALSPNTIHTQDSCHLRMAVVHSRMDVSLVHDSYGSHACNFFAFNGVLRQTMWEMYKNHDMLLELTERNNMSPISFLDNGYDVDMILEAKNCFG
ncbi:DNA-directed RNA polymerase [Vibrio phage phiV141]|uniref:DNA-directed RNA polymerase n=1 Tax=Vibrio phage phiV141 TaxID=2723905 RepID=A0A7D7EUK5_9CAUD|nr:DNA-directed RNA polymerase [Vibrio phage phiV141]